MEQRCEVSILPLFFIQQGCCHCKLERDQITGLYYKYNYQFLLNAGMHLLTIQSSDISYIAMNKIMTFDIT